MPRSSGFEEAGSVRSHSTILVLDGTVGQNAHSQVKAFKDMVDVSGLIVTKLDGSARGGVVVALADQFGLPVHAVGVGEGLTISGLSRPKRSQIRSWGLAGKAVRPQSLPQNMVSMTRSGAA